MQSVSIGGVEGRMEVAKGEAIFRSGLKATSQL